MLFYNMNVTHKPGWSHTLLYDTVYDNLNKMFLTECQKIIVGSGLRLGLGLWYSNPNFT